MGKPSIFSSDYKKVMRKRKRIFRLTIVLAAVFLLFLIYSNSAIPKLKKVAQSVKLPTKIHYNKDLKKNGSTGKLDTKDNTVSNKNDDKNSQEKATVNGSIQSKGEYPFKFPNGELISIKYTKEGDKIKLTGINPETTGIFYDIREDGGCIAFDNPRLNDIWVFNSDGTSRKISPDSYKQSGENGEVFSKASVMESFKNNYVWASRPKFLKDGRIIYQSNLPWFKQDNLYYLWVVNYDGQNNRLLANTKSSKPCDYNGFTAENNLEITIDGRKFVVNIGDGSIQALN